jgi:DNA-binding transcriptional LysR family regulator
MDRDAASTRRPSYKEVRLQQMRSFLETARLGSLAAAAAALGVAQPTVWKQVHALERQYGVKLVEPHKRGCRLTDDGQLLLQLADPLVTGFDSLPRQFREARGMAAVGVTVVTTPRILVEDLSPCVVAFEERWPRVRLTFKETRDEDVAKEVESGGADLGLVQMTEAQADNPRLAFEACYQVDIVLITPKDHPLAHRTRVRPRDLCPYPLVNSPNAFDPALAATLEALGLFRTEPRRVEAFFAATIRHFVELGFGIGLIPRPAHTPYPNLHQRVMSRYFGRATIYLIQRKGALQSPAAHAFAETVKVQMSRPPSRPRSR